MARSVDADRDDLPGVFSSLYELMRRSTSAECGLAAKSRASATLNAFQHSVLQTYWYKSLGFHSSRSFNDKWSETSRYDITNSDSGTSGTISLWHSRSWSSVVLGNMWRSGSSSLNSVSGIRVLKNYLYCKLERRRCCRCHNAISAPRPLGECECPRNCPIVEKRKCKVTAKTLIVLFASYLRQNC